MPITLGIDDEESVDIVRHLENCFGVVISDAEAEACRTLGDVYDLLLPRFEGREGRFCASAMAFYRVRRACRPFSAEIELRPSTPLTALTDMSVRQLFKRIEQATHLQLPGRASSWIGTLGAVGLLIGVFGPIFFSVLSNIGLVSAKWAWTPAIMLVLSPCLLSLDPGVLPENCTTLGELSRRVAGLNFRRFAEAGARVNRQELWDALTEAVAPYTTLPITQMCPEALLLESQRKTA